jgi:XTP/dITP diphosphohydrolase
VTSTRVVLVETAESLPGLLPFQAWDALATADEVLVRDASTHPVAAHLHAAGLDLVTLDPVALERADLDLSRPGSPDDRRRAKALVARVEEGRTPVYLLGPDDEGLAAALAGMAAERDLEIELVFFAPQPPGTEMLRLVEVLARLRDPDGGCPWDLQQDHDSLVPYLVEEAYELVDAIEQGDDADLVEELGDVLLQIVFHARIAEDRHAFGIDAVARGIVDKLVARHPHVFADADVDTAADVEANWERLKAAEKGRTSIFDGVPAAMPGLHLLDKLLHKAAKHGRSPDDGPASDRLRALIAGDTWTEARLGDLLLAVVDTARAHGIDPERAARGAAERFRSRVDESLPTSDGGADTADVDGIDRA